MYGSPVNDRQLAGLEHANYIEAISLAGEIPDSLIRRAGGVAVVLSGLDLRLFNQIFVEDDRATPDAIASGVATARARGADFIVSLRRGIDDRWIPLLSSLGLAPAGPEQSVPGMALHPIPPGDGGAGPGAGGGRATPDGDRYDVRLVTDEAGLEDHIEVVTAGFGLPEPIVRSFMSPQLLGRPELTLYVGYVGHRAVTSGLGIRTGRTIGVYNISTTPEARRHGYGTAMTARIARDGAEAGCDVAILQASTMGRPIYERMGYRTVAVYDGYEDPAGSAPTPGDA